ncbi:MAG: DUF262 domain-containing protein [Chloroflexi bacterium]|nr:DUF262 domain-containing protein [Chloroflexota bacterium]
MNVASFDTTKRLVEGLLEEVGNGKTQLPDFQRGWVWDDHHIRDLIASVSLSFPIGAVMTLETGGPDVNFKPRPIEGADESLREVSPDLLVLDGQQRLTSLFQSLKTGKPVATRDTKDNEISRWYYLDMKKCLDDDVDREEAVLSVPEDRKVKTFRGEVTLDLSTPENEYANDIFPLRYIFNEGVWMKGYIEYWQLNADKWSLYQEFNERVIKRFGQYQVPVIELDKETPKEAVCIVFEKVNQGGVSLTVFELLTASFAADDFQLREDWENREERLRNAHPVLSGMENTLFLQALTLLATKARGNTISCRRRDILRLRTDEYKEWANKTEQGFMEAAKFLHGQKIFNNRDLPYRTQLVPLAAILADLENVANTEGARQKIARWFWCGILGEMYGGTTETRFSQDLIDVTNWVHGESELPRTIQDANFQANRLLTLRTRNSAAYKGIHALLMRDGSRDFLSGIPIEDTTFFDESVDIHHIFPRNWCARQGIGSSLFNSIVNKTAISARTNRSIGGRAPSLYLPTLERNAKVSPEVMDEILESHRIPAWTLRLDDFNRFFADRAEGLLERIESAMGKQIAREEGIFRQEERDDDFDINAVIDNGESVRIEFKSSLRMNLHTNKTDKRMELAALKTLAAFLNSDGGSLLIGVADDHEPVGIQIDGFPNEDRMNLHLGNIVNRTMGALAMQHIDISFQDFRGVRIMVLTCERSNHPVFVKDGNEEVFYIRSGAATQSLSIKDAHTYINDRF